MLTPINDNILVRRDTAETKTPTGLHLPSSVIKNSEPNSAEVLALGEGRKNPVTGNYDLPFSVDVGSKVILAQHGGTPLELSTGNFMMVTQEDILAIAD